MPVSTKPKPKQLSSIPVFHSHHIMRFSLHIILMAYCLITGDTEYIFKNAMFIVSGANEDYYYITWSTTRWDHSLPSAWCSCHQMVVHDYFIYFFFLLFFSLDLTSLSNALTILEEPRPWSWSWQCRQYGAMPTWGTWEWWGAPLALHGPVAISETLRSKTKSWYHNKNLCGFVCYPFKRNWVYLLHLHFKIFIIHT